MRVLLLAFNQPRRDGLVFTRELVTDDMLASFTGQPVLDRPGDGCRIGTVRRAVVDDAGVWGDLALDSPRLPHELAVELPRVLPGLPGGTLVKQ